MQRSMLRRFAAPRRGTDEDFVIWIRRATHIAVDAATSAGVGCWVRDHLKAKWLWAGHVARMSEYREESWAFKATFWRNAEWKRNFEIGSPLHSLRPLRSRAGRWTRWEDQIVKFCESKGIDNWARCAADKTEWSEMASAFAREGF